MDKQLIIENTINFVKQTLAGAEGGHDWWHIQRVWQLARTISESEEADSYVVQLGALLHDIADAKFHNGNETIGSQLAADFMKTQNVSDEVIEHVVAIIDNVSFKGGNTDQKFKSIELDIVQDADRLDAIGAIGIARTFNYGGFKNREMYNPDIAPKLDMTKEEYRNSTAPTINHFYEKLLLLKDRMNTSTGKQMAEHRHRFMEQYLEEFYAEWEGKL
jgi:uncharacterized protein